MRYYKYHQNRNETKEFNEKYFIIQVSLQTYLLCLLKLNFKSFIQADYYPNMLRMATKITRSFSQQLKLPSSTFDISNSVGYLNASDVPTMSLFDKFACFNPVNIYHSFDVFTREFLFTLANDYNLGVPLAIVVSSLVIRGLFFYPTIRAQSSALKMKELKPFMNAYQQKMRAAQMTRNKALMQAAREEYKQVQKKKGIDNFFGLVSVLQMPILISWFLSLRYVSAMPEIFPSASQSFLWIPDLSAYDPYFILPILSAVLSSYSIVISPGLKNGATMPLFQPFMKYLKFLPFVSLPLTGFFPATLTLYWCSLSFVQAAIMVAMNTKYVQNKYVLQTEVAKPQITRAIFVEEKAKKVEGQPETEIRRENKLDVEIPKNIQKIQILSKKPKKAKKE